MLRMINTLDKDAVNQGKPTYPSHNSKHTTYSVLPTTHPTSHNINRTTQTLQLEEFRTTGGRSYRDNVKRQNPNRKNSNSPHTAKISGVKTGCVQIVLKIYPWKGKPLNINPQSQNTTLCSYPLCPNCADDIQHQSPSSFSISFSPDGAVDGIVHKNGDVA